jgi:hypothetical protein
MWRKYMRIGLYAIKVCNIYLKHFFFDAVELYLTYGHSLCDNMKCPLTLVVTEFRSSQLLCQSSLTLSRSREVTAKTRRRLHRFLWQYVYVAMWSDLAWRNGYSFLHKDYTQIPNVVDECLSLLLRIWQASRLNLGAEINLFYINN